MPKEKNKKILTIAIIFLALLISVIIFIIVNPTNSPTITKTKEKIFLFGEPSDGNNSATSTDNYNSLNNTEGQVAEITRITSEPIAGAHFVTNKENENAVRYVEQKTGDIYEYSLKNRRSERLLQQNLLGTHIALWTKSGENVLLRFLKSEEDNETIKTYANSLENGASGSSTTATGKFLPDNLQEIVTSPIETEKVAYLQENNGNTFVILEDLLNAEDRQQIFASPLNQWLLEWPKEDLIVLTTKPSYDIEGYSFFVNTKEGKAEKVLGKIKGLTTLVSPDATKILYARSEKNIFSSAVYDVKTKTETPLGLKILPEKCVWGTENPNLLYCAVSNFPDNTVLPDDWYKGKVSFSDEFWVINTETGKSGVINKMIDFSERGIDVTGVSLNSKNDYLLFTNKKDNSLWMLKLEITEVAKESNNIPINE